MRIQKCDFYITCLGKVKQGKNRCARSNCDLNLALKELNALATDCAVMLSTCSSTDSWSRMSSRSGCISLMCNTADANEPFKFDESFMKWALPKPCTRV